MKLKVSVIIDDPVCTCGAKLHPIYGPNEDKMTFRPCPSCMAEEFREGLRRGREVREDHRKHG